MNPTTLIILGVMVFGVGVTHCAGVLEGGIERCICKGNPLKWMRSKAMQKVEVFLKSASCSKIEIIVTHRKTRARVCLDPNGKQGQRILRNKRFFSGWNPKTKSNQKRAKKQRRQ